MEQLAPPGSIRLTAETWKLAEGFVQVTPLGSAAIFAFLVVFPGLYVLTKIACPVFL